jgi:hypothetical protein
MRAVFAAICSARRQVHLSTVMLKERSLLPNKYCVHPSLYYQWVPRRQSPGCFSFSFSVCSAALSFFMIVHQRFRHPQYLWVGMCTILIYHCSSVPSSLIISHLIFLLQWQCICFFFLYECAFPLTHLGSARLSSLIACLLFCLEWVHHSPTGRIRLWKVLPWRIQNRFFKIWTSQFIFLISWSID